MTSGILIVGDEQRIEISAAIERAKAKPMPWSVMKAIVSRDATTTLLLGDRKIGVEEARAKYPPQNVMLGTYRCAISFEEQPAGLMRHLSVSSQKKGKVPGPEVMQMVCEEFKFSALLCSVIGMPQATVVSDQVPFRVWLEEFEPGRMAVNVAELVT